MMLVVRALELFSSPTVVCTQKWTELKVVVAEVVNGHLLSSFTRLGIRDIDYCHTYSISTL